MTFSVVIACIHLALCPLPQGHSLAHFDAENADTCERNIRMLIALDGLHGRDFIVACAPERRI
jgi:hypothetical protein